MQPVVWPSLVSCKPDLPGWLLPSGFSGSKSLNTSGRSICSVLSLSLAICSSRRCCKSSEMRAGPYMFVKWCTLLTRGHYMELNCRVMIHIFFWKIHFGQGLCVAEHVFGARAGHRSYLWNSLHAGGSNTNQGAQGPPSASDLVSDLLMLFTLRREEVCSLFAPTGRQCLVCTSVHRQAGRGVCDVQIGWCSQHSLDCTVVFQKEETPNNMGQRKVFPKLHNCWILCWRSRNSDNWFQVTKRGLATRNFVRYTHAHHQNRPDRDKSILISSTSRFMCLS